MSSRGRKKSLTQIAANAIFLAGRYKNSMAPALSRREREIMDVLHRAGELAAADIQKALPDPPGYSAVRAMLRTLEEKGHIKHREQDLRYVYAPVVSAA